MITLSVIAHLLDCSCCFYIFLIPLIARTVRPDVYLRSRARALMCVCVCMCTCARVGERGRRKTQDILLNKQYMFISRGELDSRKT